MLDNLLEKESYTFREPFEIRMEELSYNISYALALLERVIPMLEAADAGHHVTQAMVAPEIAHHLTDNSWVQEFVESVNVPDTIPENIQQTYRAEAAETVRNATPPPTVITDEEVDRKFREIQAHEATQQAYAKVGQ